MKMLSLKPHVYAGRRLKTDEEFECRGQSDRRLLIALGRAKDAPVVAALLKARELTPTGVVLTEGDADADLRGLPRPDNHNRSSWVENEPVNAQPYVEATTINDSEPVFVEAGDQPRPWSDYEAPAEISPRTGKPKRTYKRRDMVAE